MTRPRPEPTTETPGEELEEIEDEGVPLAAPGDTGDDHKRAMWLIILLAAAGALGGTVAWKKKKQG